MSKRTYELVTIQPDGTTTRETFAQRPGLEPLQKAVGGLIEHVRVRFEGRVREAYVNEEGLIDGLAYNEKASALGAPFGYSGFVGPVAIIVTRPVITGGKTCEHCVG